VTFQPPKGEPPEVRWEPCCALRIDEAYQRVISGKQSQSLIREIAENWDWRLCAPLTVSHRADEAGEMAFFVIDGQHRLAAAEMRGDIEELPCIISVFGGFEEEALAFIAINTARRQVTALDKYHARVAAKEPLALKIKAAVADADLSVARNSDASTWTAREIAFPDAVGRALTNYAVAGTKALEALAWAYPAVPLLRGADLFEGMLVIFRHGGKGWTGDELRDFASHVGAMLQSSWVARRDRKKLEADTWTTGGAMAFVMMEGYRQTPKPAALDPRAPAAVSKAPPATLEDATASYLANRDDGRLWCEQCDRRVTATVAGMCVSKFCSVRVTA
jgi:hypothetical protein